MFFAFGCFSTLKILATVKLPAIADDTIKSFSTLKILATVKLTTFIHWFQTRFSTLKILATVKLIKRYNIDILVLVPLRF